MRTSIQSIVGVSIALFGFAALMPQDASADVANCTDISLAGVSAALQSALGGQTNDPDINGGLPTAQWVSIVDRDGNLCAVFFSGSERDDQWPASRVISMQKANTANSLSLDELALSSANLWSATQPGGSLFGLQFSNPVHHGPAYKGSAMNFGQGDTDPAVGERIGGINVFGGGLALYDGSEEVIGGIGTSGNTSCADHIITWKVRDALDLDYVPGGVSPTNDDNIIFDLESTSPGKAGKTGFGHVASASGFGHPECGFGERPIAENLPTSHPIKSEE